MFVSHFRGRLDLPEEGEKHHLESGLNQRDRATAVFFSLYIPPEAKQNFLLAGLCSQIEGVRELRVGLHHDGRRRRHAARHRHRHGQAEVGQHREAEGAWVLGQRT